MTDHEAKPVVIIGAGVSGLLLAQNLRKEKIPFRIFERDSDLTTRGVGWGLTLHWSLPALRALLPHDLIERLPYAYVDRAAVDGGAASTFPFFDLSTGELKAATPKASESQRIRVTRERLRKLLATDLNIEWNKTFSEFRSDRDSITVDFEDGSSVEGCLLVACDGGHSRVRRALFPDQHKSLKLPIRVLGAKAWFSPEQMEPLRKLDPYFLQGTASGNNTFVYFSLLDAPGNNYESTDKYNCQMCVSWPYREGFLNSPSPMEFPSTDASKHELVQAFAGTWAEPFRSFALSMPEDTEIKPLELYDFVPPKGLRSRGRAILMGDAFHAMAMYRGEGANHAIVDVLDFSERLVPGLHAGGDNWDAMRAALDEYEDVVIDRARPGVLASRRACLDAHDWVNINSTSPLLSRREMKLKFDEEE